MPSLVVDGLTFNFPPGWQVGKYDDWSYYRNQFAKQRNGLKAVDVVALGTEQDAYLIEVKDYRRPDTDNPFQLPEVIANKVLYSLAAMLPAKLNATDSDEKRLAGAILGCVSLRVIAHIEQPLRHHPAVDLADIKQKLRQLLRAVDAHPKVVSMGDMRNLPWSVA